MILSEKCSRKFTWKLSLIPSKFNSDKVISLLYGFLCDVEKSKGKTAEAFVCSKYKT